MMACLELCLVQNVVSTDFNWWILLHLYLFLSVGSSLIIRSFYCQPFSFEVPAH